MTFPIGHGKLPDQLPVNALTSAYLTEQCRMGDRVGHLILGGGTG
jgi:hypothetical protein